MKFSTSIFAAPAMFAAFLLLTNCGSSDSPPAETGGSPSAGPDGAAYSAVKTLIGSSCFGNGCHSQEGNPLQMEIDDKLYGTLMSHTTKTCGKLINTASPADSAIIKLLKGDCNGTMRMPYQMCWNGDPQDQAPCVSTANLTMLQNWIASGAPRQ
jgi:hypothetical protein